MSSRGAIRRMLADLGNDCRGSREVQIIDLWRKNLPYLFCFLVLAVWLAVFGRPYFFDSLTNNYQEIQTYELDGKVMLRALEAALSHPLLRIDFDDYGHFYLNLAIVVSKIYAVAFPPTEHALFFILRSLTFIGGLLSVGMVLIFARRFFGSAEAVFAA